jgi:glutamine amidotransferase
MQWNVLDPSPAAAHEGSGMFEGLEPPTWVYFVHSYAADASPEVVATCHYGGAVTAAVARGRLWATQFHPEKSGAAGLRILANFVASL